MGMASLTQKLAYWPFHFICRFFLNFEIKGEENCQSLSGPLIIAANHKSYLDGIILVSALPYDSLFFPIRFIVKRAVYFTPILHFFLKITGGIPIKKGINLNEKLKIPLKILENKGTIAIFPEGARIFNEKLGQGKRGVAFLSLKNNALILPVNIQGALGINPFNFVFRRKKIIVSIGVPFYLPAALSCSNESDLLAGVQMIMRKIKDIGYNNENSKNTSIFSG